MISLLQIVLRLSVAGGVTCLAVFASTALLRHRLPKAWLYGLWLVAVLRFMIPISFSLPVTFPQLIVFPEQTAADTAFVNESAAVGDWQAKTASSQAAKAPSPLGNQPGAPASRAYAGQLNAPKLMALVWVSGAGAMLIWYTAGYGLTMRKLKRERVLLRKGRVPVYVNWQVTTPILAGLIHPAVYLPEAFSGAELAIYHELCHLRRGDIWARWLIQLVVCIHWFNPLVYLMKREMNCLSELSCDEAVVREMDDEGRRAYGYMLLEVLRSASGFGGPMVASFGKNKRLIQERMRAIMKKRIVTRKTIIVMTVMALVVIGAAVLSGCALRGVTPTAAGSTPENTPQTSAAGVAASNSTFVSDPDVIGTWETVANIESITGFDPAKQMNQETNPMEFVFSQNGVMNSPDWSWTKGQISIPYVGKTFNYEIREINGLKYLFVNISGKSSGYLALKWTSADSSFAPLTDDINLPFKDDPAVIGTWNSVDGVKNIADFDPANKAFPGALYLTQLVFSKDGVLSESTTSGNADTRFSWTKGVVIDPMYKTASAYEIKEINGSTYLFFEFKSGDYVYRHMKPGYFVLKKA